MPNQDTTTTPSATGGAASPELEAARDGYQQLLDGFLTVQLATADAEGNPEASYAPAVMDANRDFYLQASELAKHLWNLRATPRASVLIIEDEGGCETIFARRRVSFDCEVVEIERHSEEWERGTALLETRHGKMAGHLKGMADFHLFRLRPLGGRLVLGFGKAYDVGGARMDELSHIGAGNGGGHRRERGGKEAR